LPPAGAGGTFARLGVPDADTASTFTASRLSRRNAAFTDSENAQVLARLGSAIDELGYERPPGA
jgi:hypothetical protein